MKCFVNWIPANSHVCLNKLQPYIQPLHHPTECFCTLRGKRKDLFLTCFEFFDQYDCRKTPLLGRGLLFIMSRFLKLRGRGTPLMTQTYWGGVFLGESSSSHHQNHSLKWVNQDKWWVNLDVMKMWVDLVHFCWRWVHVFFRWVNWSISPTTCANLNHKFIHNLFVLHPLCIINFHPPRGSFEDSPTWWDHPNLSPNSPSRFVGLLSTSQKKWPKFTTQLSTFLSFFQVLGVDKHLNH